MAAAVVTIEMDGEAEMRAVVYLRRNGRVGEHSLSPQPVRDFDSAISDASPPPACAAPHMTRSRSPLRDRFGDGLDL